MPLMAVDEAKWKAIIAEYRASKLSALEFSQQRQVSVHAVRYWSARLKPSKEIRLARLLRDDASDGQIVIEGSGVRIAVAPGFDRATLRAVLEVLAEIGNAATR
jgi:hypothetical protein